MPLLTEREHMQLWCQEARVVVLDAQPQEGPRVAVPGADPSPVRFIEASPPLNRMDFNPGGLRIPQSCLCFGSKCGAWQWSNWHRGTDNRHYPTRDQMKAKDPNMTGWQLGYCGKAAPIEIVAPAKPTSLPAPEEAPAPPAEQPQGETRQ